MIAIVNRRNSDLTDKADGVLYTSDGRDVEMSVASTKAFYSQIAAGFLLAVRDGRRGRHRRPDVARAALLEALRDAARRRWRATLARRPAIADAAQRFAPAARYWAVVGNGANHDRRPRGAHQALRALLQVDRLRRHRGQEAHRPVVASR